MFKSIVIFLFVSISFFDFGQNFGYYGRKNIADFNVSIYTPMIQNWTDNDYEYRFYKKRGSTLTSANDRLEMAFSASYLRSLSRNVSFGLEFGFQKMDLNAPIYLSREIYDPVLGYNIYQNMNGKIENFKCNHIFIVPKFEFSHKDGIFGMGVKHQVGLGFGKTTFLNKDYLFDLKVSENSGWSDYYVNLSESQKATFKNEMFNFEQNKFQNLIMFYALYFRKPLSKSLFLNYGFKYTLNFINKSSGFVNENNKYWISNEQLESMVQRDRLTNVISFKVGFSYAF
ncbi:MAG: hypothetical protein ACK5B9_01770 [Flavobacteriia bacterium]|jgi:hypothetical protein